MADLQFDELQLGDHGSQPRTVVIGRHSSKSVRDLLEVLVRLTFQVRDRPNVLAVCVATDSRLSDARLAEEHGRLRSILHPELAARIHWMRIDESAGSARTSLDAHDQALAQALASAIPHRSPPPLRPTRLGARALTVAQLVEDRLQCPLSPARTIAEWQGVCGVSYPTLASVVSELRQRGLVEESRRHGRTASKKQGMKLRALATNEVMRLVREFCAVRPVQLFVDPTGFATPSRLMTRLTRLQQAGQISAEVRVGGVHAASYYFPQIDVTGAPRLDLTSPTQIDAATIDGALRPLSNSEPSSSAVLAVHLIHQTGSEIDPASKPTHPWSTSFESLADLVELGFEREALEMAAALCEAGRSSSSAN